MSPVAEQLQDALKRTEHHEEIHLKGTNKSRSRDECRKNLISNIDQLVKSERVSLKVLRDFDDALLNLRTMSSKNCLANPFQTKMIVISNLLVMKNAQGQKKNDD